MLKTFSESFKRSWFHKVCTINHYLLGAVVGKWLSYPVKFVKKNIFSVSNFFMHIFNMSGRRDRVGGGGTKNINMACKHGSCSKF